MADRPSAGAHRPTRLGGFLVALGFLAPGCGIVFSLDWHSALLFGFDLAALLFLLSLWPIFRGSDAETMRRRAAQNDANRALMLLVTLGVMLAILTAVATELSGKSAPQPFAIALAVASLAIAWIFSNMVYAMHYAHLFYLGNDQGEDCGGLDFPDTPTPEYWDFVYFSFTLGMTFQTSDVEIKTAPLRRLVIIHSLAAFVFNLGILAFSINILGSL